MRTKQEYRAVYLSESGKTKLIDSKISAYNAEDARRQFIKAFSLNCPKWTESILISRQRKTARRCTAKTVPLAAQSKGKELEELKGKLVFFGTIEEFD